MLFHRNIASSKIILLVIISKYCYSQTMFNYIFYSAIVVDHEKNGDYGW